METKRNLKYYIAPPISIVTIIGLVIIAVSLFFVFNEKYRMPGILVMIVGLGVTLFSSGGKSNDTDIEFQARALTSDLAESNMKKYEVYEKNFLKMLKPVDLAGYDFEATESEFYYRKGSDGTPRTNYFKAYNLIFTGEKVYIYGRRLSLTDESINETLTSSYKYTELDHAEIEEKIFTSPKGDKVTYHVFRILAKDGNAIIDTCIDYGADSDKAVDNINRAIDVRCEELEKKAQERAEKLRDFRAKVMAGTADLPKEQF